MRLLILLLPILFFSCDFDKFDRVKGSELQVPQLISKENNSASGPFFLKNNKDIPVLVWTEKLSGGDETGHIVKFANWNKDNNSFEKTKEVSTSTGCRAHDESMSKLAFKKDGTMICVFSKRTPTKKNKYAGALFYTQSFDNGNEWTEAKYLHIGDTTYGISRSFFDIAMLKDGEVGAVWLDSRLTKERGDGSSLFFAKTDGKNGFLEDKVIGTSTCECCRTDLFISNDGDLQVTYRDIRNDSIRDMSIVISQDNGASFSNPKRISNDNWAINGCPHTGPSLGETTDELHCVWFTMGGGRGIYYTNSNDDGISFKERKLLTNKGRHPQLLATDNDLVFVWEESSNTLPDTHQNHGKTASSYNEKNNTPAASTIKAQIWNNGHPVSEHWISQTNNLAKYPVITFMGNDNVGIAWVQKIDGDKYGIYFRNLQF